MPRCAATHAAHALPHDHPVLTWPPTPREDTWQVGCKPCADLRPFYTRVASRVRHLGLASRLRIARLDVKAEPLPSHLKPVPLEGLPIILMLPAKRKEAPFSLFHGTARPKELLYFAQRHASYPFELPPNPHLTR